MLTKLTCATSLSDYIDLSLSRIQRNKKGVTGKKNTSIYKFNTLLLQNIRYYLQKS